MIQPRSRPETGIRPINHIGAVAREVIDRNRPEPLWAQLRVLLSQMIQAGDLKAGDRLPSEHALVNALGVSRPVVRAALASLERTGLVVKVARRGVFVARERDALDFAASNLGLFSDLKAKGVAVTTRTKELVRTEASERETSLLDLLPGVEVIRLKRTYIANGTPIALGNITVPAGLAPGLEALDFENQSFYRTLADHYGLRVARAERWLEAIVIGGEDARRLALPVGAPVLRVESIGWTEDGVPLEYYNSLYNTALNRFHLFTAPMDERPLQGSEAT